MARKQAESPTETSLDKPQSEAVQEKTVKCKVVKAICENGVHVPASREDADGKPIDYIVELPVSRANALQSRLAHAPADAKVTHDLSQRPDNNPSKPPKFS